VASGPILTQDISPWYVGQLSPLWTFTATALGIAMNLTGATSARVIFVLANSGIETVGSGTTTLADPATGTVTYQVAATDVTTPGQYNIYLEVTMPNGLLISDPVPWTLTGLT
jgi:hypothetical protein